MNTIKFSINVEAYDCYVYGGYLFIIRINGDIIYIPMSSILHQLSLNYPDYKSLLTFAFSRNDYFSNTTGRLFLGVSDRFHNRRCVNIIIVNALLRNQLADNLLNTISAESPHADYHSIHQLFDYQMILQAFFQQVTLNS